MLQSEIFNKELQSVVQEIKELKEAIAASTSVGITKALEASLDELQNKEKALNDSLAAAVKYETLHNKDWEAVMNNYPELKPHYETTMAIGGAVSYNTINAKLSLKMVEKGAKSMLIEGPSGTGKTTFFRYLGAHVNRPVISLNASNGMTEEDILGKYVIIDGKPVFQEGLLLLAMRTGSIFVIEEINGAKPSVMLLMNSLLDDIESINHPAKKGEIIKPADGFLFGGTLNNGYAGTRKMNKAFVNRFQVAFQMEEMSKTAMKEILEKKIPDVTEEELKVGWYVFKSLDNVIKREEYNAVVSIRQIMNLIMTKREDAEYANGKAKHSWRAAINLAVRSQVTGFDSDMDGEVDRVIESLFTNTDKMTGVFSEAVKPMFEGYDDEPKAKTATEEDEE